MKIRPILRFALRVCAIAAALLTVPWFLGAALAATGASVVPPPMPDAIAAYLTSYGPLVGGLTLAYVVGGFLLRKYASSHWLAQGKRLAWATALLGIAGTALQAYVSGTPVSGVLATAVLGLLHIADAQVAPAPGPKAAQSGRVAVAAMVWVSCAGLLGIAVLGSGCAGSTQASRQTTIGSLDSAIQTAAAALRSYEHEHTAALIQAAPDKPTGAAVIAAFRIKVDKVWLAVDTARAAIDAANTINDDTSLAGARTALDNAITAITALTGGTTP